MTERTRPAPRLGERGKAEAARRHERLAEALRANLKRRKAQARARGDKDSPSGKA